MLLHSASGFLSLPGDYRSSRDPYFSSVGYLLHFDGTNGSTTITDSGSHGISFAFSGVTGSISTSQSLFGGASWSGSGGGSGQVFASGAPISSYVKCSGSTPWFWEMAFYASNFTAAQVLWDNNNNSTNNTGWQIYVGTDGKLYVYNGTNYGGYGSAMATGQWYRLAIGWDGTKLYFFVNGALLNAGGVSGFTNTWGSSNQLWIANSAFISQGLSGYVDEHRWTSGICRYTANFTPPSAAFPNS